MKYEIGIKKPDHLTEDWPGKYDVFSWLEYVVTIPNPIFIITTNKQNGKANANLNSWGILMGEGEEFYSLVALLNHTHTFKNIIKEKEWVINYPDFTHYPESFETIYNNDLDKDEIISSGFTIEESKKVSAPRIKESMINLECRLDWEKALFPGSKWSLFCGKVLNVAMEEKTLSSDPVERIKNMKLMYNVRSTINPLNGEQYGPNTLGLIKEMYKITSDDGMEKYWQGEKNYKKIEL